MPAPSTPIEATVRQDKAAGVLSGTLPAIGWYFGKWCHQMQTLLDVRDHRSGHMEPSISDGGTLVCQCHTGSEHPQTALHIGLSHTSAIWISNPCWLAFC